MRTYHVRFFVGERLVGGVSVQARDRREAWGEARRTEEYRRCQKMASPGKLLWDAEAWSSGMSAELHQRLTQEQPVIEEDTDYAYMEQLTQDWKDAVDALERERQRTELYRVSIGVIAVWVSSREGSLPKAIRSEIARLNKKLRECKR